MKDYAGVMCIPKTPLRFFQVALLLAAMSLAFAYIAEYGFRLMPCELCLKQRIPYALVILFSVIGWCWKDKIIITRLQFVLIAIAFMVGSGLGIYHAGVEKKIFTGPSACTQEISDKPLSIDELRKQILGAPLVACDQPAWEWNGITMAGMNAVWSLVLFLYTIAAAGKLGWRKQ